MAKTKVIKKVSARKRTVRTRSKGFRMVRNRTLSFFIGVITVLLIGFLLFNYAQQNNYKTVLGERTKSSGKVQKVSGGDQPDRR